MVSDDIPPITVFVDNNTSGELVFYAKVTKGHKIRGVPPLKGTLTGEPDYIHVHVEVTDPFNPREDEDGEVEG